MPGITAEYIFKGLRLLFISNDFCEFPSKRKSSNYCILSSCKLSPPKKLFDGTFLSLLVNVNTYASHPRGAKDTKTTVYYGKEIRWTNDIKGNIC